RICPSRAAGSFESGISARYLASTSLHSMPRGPDPRGASTVLVNRWPDVVTTVTLPPQLHLYVTCGGAGSRSTNPISLATVGSKIFPSVAWTQVNSLSATAEATKDGKVGR